MITPGNQSGQPRCFETWQTCCQALAAATAYWQAHRQPLRWGQLRSYEARWQAGMAIALKAA